MKRISKKAAAILCMAVLLLIPMTLVFANAGNSSVSKNQTVARDWFAIDQAVSNAGTIKGDFIALGQSLTSAGRIEGDLLCAASDVSMTGKVEGDVRVAAAAVTLSGEIGKNVNAFASNVLLSNSAYVGGNLIAFASTMEVDGTVKGYSRLNGGRIVLKGDFAGDVDINVDDGYGDPNVELHVLPGTKIHGKLTYKGLNEAFIADGAQVNSFQWIQADEKAKSAETKGAGEYAVKYLRMLIAAAIYFFIAMLVYRLFPGLFAYQGSIIGEKPLKVLGMGLAAVGLVFAAIITFIFLLAVTAFIASPMVAVVFGTAMTLAYVLIFYFSTIPVSMWLGNVLLNGKNNVPTRFGIGFLTITAVQVLLKLLGEVSPAGIIFSTLWYIFVIIIGIFGAGALIYGIGNTVFRLRRADSVE